MAPAAVSVGQFLRLALSFSVCLLSIHRTGRDDQPLSSTHISNGGSIHRTGISTPSSQFRRQSDTMDLVASLAGVQWLARQLVAALTMVHPGASGLRVLRPGPESACLLCLLFSLKAATDCLSFIQAPREWQGFERAAKEKREMRYRRFWEDHIPRM